MYVLSFPLEDWEDISYLFDLPPQSGEKEMKKMRADEPKRESGLESSPTLGHAQKMMREMMRERSSADDGGRER